MDIVSYSREFDETQERLVAALGDLVWQTAEVLGTADVIMLPTGDGVFLAFPGRTSAAALAFGLHVHERINAGLRRMPLRMGVHEGPVRVIRDLNGNRNVVGTAVNLAQRVMDVGDAGHITLSETAHVTVASSEQFRGCLQPLNEGLPVEVKHGIPLRLFQYRDASAGSWDAPQKVRDLIGINAASMGRVVPWQALLAAHTSLKMLDLSMPLFGTPAVLDHLEGLLSKGVAIQVLLLNPLSATVEVRRTSAAYDDESELETTIEYVVKILRGFRGRLAARLGPPATKRFEVRLFNSTPSMSALISDETAYLSPYMEHLSGSRGPCLTVSAGSRMYECAVANFDALWNERSVSLFAPELPDQIEALIKGRQDEVAALALPPYLSGGNIKI